MEDTGIDPQTEGRSDVGFPEAKKQPKKNKLPLLITIVLAIIILAAVAFFVISKPSTIEDDTNGTTQNSPTPTSEVSPTPTESQLVRGEISVSVLNGTAISGLAAKAKTALEKLGYSEIETGNASKKDYEVTEVKFASSVPTAAKDEIIAELNKTFEEVKTVSGTPSGADVEIITGFPKGHTVTPTAKAVTATPKPTSSTTLTPTGSVTGTITVTATPTKTPTPTPTP